MSVKVRAMAEKWVGQRPVFVLAYTSGFIAYAVNAALGLQVGDVAPFHLQLIAWAAAACAVMTVTYSPAWLRRRDQTADAIINDELAASFRAAGMRWGFFALLGGTVAMLVATLVAGATPLWMLVMVPTAGVSFAALRFAWSDHRSAQGQPSDD